MGKKHSYAGGQRRFPPLCLSGDRSGQSRFDRPVHQTVPKSRSRTAEKLCPAKAQAGTACPQACHPEKTGAGAITMAKRKRDVPVLFWVSAEELELIHQKMQQYGTENLSAYLRKMVFEFLCVVNLILGFIHLFKSSNNSSIL